MTAGAENRGWAQKNVPLTAIKHDGTDGVYC